MPDEPITLDLIGEILQRMQVEQRTIREAVRSLDDQMLIQTNILLRLDDPDRGTNTQILRLLANLQRLEARVRTLEDQLR